MPRGRPKKEKSTHPVIIMLNARIEALGITKTEVACALLDLMDSPKPCDRSWKSNVYRWLGGGGKDVIVTPNERARKAMLKWLELHPSIEK